MDELDKKLYHDLKLEMQIPEECEKIIKECLNKKEKHYPIIKIPVAACSIIILTMGVVYAGTKVYEKIWKNPEKVVGFYSNENNDENVIIQEENAMTEEEARKKANEILKKFGHENEEIESIELKGDDERYLTKWNIKTNKETHLSFYNGKSENLTLICNNESKKNKQQYDLNQEQAEDIARNLCEKFGYDTREYTYTRIISSKGYEIKPNETVSTWYVKFFKQYDGIINPWEKIEIGFGPGVNEISYFIVSNAKCENNPVKITKEQAKEIALKEEQKITTPYKIKNINVELCIDAMNSDAYFRITNYEQYRKQQTGDYPAKNIVSYRTKTRIRKIMVATITYDIPESVDRFDESFNSNDEYYSYFIDATTGEVIGGFGDYEFFKGTYMNMYK